MSKIKIGFPLVCPDCESRNLFQLWNVYKCKDCICSHEDTHVLVHSANYEIKSLTEKLEKLKAFSSDYQIYVHHYMIDNNDCTPFHGIRKKVYKHAIERGEKPIWNELGEFENESKR